MRIPVGMMLVQRPGQPDELVSATAWRAARTWRRNTDIVIARTPNLGYEPCGQGVEARFSERVRGRGRGRLQGVAGRRRKDE